MKKKPSNRSKGQSTIEYLLIVVFGAIFSMEVVKFFNGVFEQGLLGLEKNVQREVATGRGFERR